MRKLFCLLDIKRSLAVLLATVFFTNFSVATAQQQILPELEEHVSAPATIEPGQIIEYNITIKNNSNVDYTYVKVRDGVPAYLTFVSEGSSPECRMASGAPVCYYNKVLAGETKQIKIRFRVATNIPCNYEISSQVDVGADNAKPNCVIVKTRVYCKPKPQCSDGLDNDQDGLKDLNDPGCSSNEDDDEKDTFSAIIPYVECVYNLGAGNYRAYFGYDNTNQTTVNISVGNNADGSINAFTPDAVNRGQINSFLPGKKVAAFSVDFNGNAITWQIKPVGSVSQVISASKTSKACSPVLPVAECADRKPGNRLQALFGYRNDNPFPIKLDIGATNTFIPTPVDRGQPIEFFSGRVVNVFSVLFDGEASWKLGSTVVRANNTLPICTPNQVPVCNAGAVPYASDCQGIQSSVALDGTASSDADSPGLSYSWATNCASASIDNATLAKPTLTLNTSSGSAVACKVFLTVSDGVDASTCSQDVSVKACALDCNGQVNGGAKFDQCGVCNGNNACLDCKGIPFGTSKVDKCGVCGGTDLCVDCAGVPFGVSKLDQCQVCNGDGRSCLKCTQQNLKDLLTELDGGAAKLKNLVVLGSRNLNKIARSDAQKQFASKAKKSASELYIQAWTTLWTEIPLTVTNCVNATICKEDDLSATIKKYSTLSSQLRDLAAQLSKQLVSAQRKARKSTASGKKLGKDASNQHNNNIGSSLNVPRFNSRC
jgi:uncharacterized repeat protein (TIGR01451 family)